MFDIFFKFKLMIYSVEITLQSLTFVICFWFSVSFLVSPLLIRLILLGRYT